MTHCGGFHRVASRSLLELLGAGPVPPFLLGFDAELPLNLPLQTTNYYQSQSNAWAANARHAAFDAAPCVRAATSVRMDVHIASRPLLGTVVVVIICLLSVEDTVGSIAVASCVVSTFTPTSLVDFPLEPLRVVPRLLCLRRLVLDALRGPLRSFFGPALEQGRVCLCVWLRCR